MFLSPVLGLSILSLRADLKRDTQRCIARPRFIPVTVKTQTKIICAITKSIPFELRQWLMCLYKQNHQSLVQPVKQKKQIIYFYQGMFQSIL